MRTLIEPKVLSYDTKKWVELPPPDPVNTLQVFITNRCNLRCKACFYAQSLGRDEIDYIDYRRIVTKHKQDIDKVILLGGEPTIHRDLVEMVRYNNALGLRTTIYTNGVNLKVLDELQAWELKTVSIRIGVYGCDSSERPILSIGLTKLPVTFCYMLRQDNVDEMLLAANYAGEAFNVTSWFISSIRDIDATGDYWGDTDTTLPLDEYREVAERFLGGYNGPIRRVEIARRGVIKPEVDYGAPTTCRFGNVFPGGKRIICPFDISKGLYTKQAFFGGRQCNKCDECLLQKVVLERCDE